MKRIVAVNGSPRGDFNTAQLVKEAARGAEAENAEVALFNLYKLEKYLGCISCFGCKTEKNRGKCIYNDGLTPVLDAIREADGLIIGSPNYLSNISAGVRALYERLIFQYITYKTSPRSYNDRKTPVLFIMTSNAPKEIYEKMGYNNMISGYQNTLSDFIGNTKVLIADNTLQVKDYSRFDWSMFDIRAKKERHESVFPNVMKNAFEIGSEMVKQPWV